MNSMRKAVIFTAGLLAGVALMFVSQNIMAVEAGSTMENFSDFLQRLNDGGEVKEVTFTGGTGIAYVGLTNKIVERGIVVKASGSR
jgi:hypothetical protein